MERKKWTVIITICLAIAMGIGGSYLFVHITNPLLEREVLEQQMEHKLSEEAEKLVQPVEAEK